MSSPYTGNPSGGANLGPSPAPGPGVAPIINIPADGIDSVNAASLFVQQLETLADFVAWLTLRAPMQAYFGDGSDGSATLDGTNTVTWATKVGSVYTMTRDAFLVNLTVTGASTVLKTAGFIPYVSGIGTTASGGKVSHDGSAGGNGVAGGGGAGGTAGSGAFSGTLLGGGNGGTGATQGGAAATNGTSVTNSMGGAGGGALSGTGTAGTATQPATTLGSIHDLTSIIRGRIVGLSGGVSTPTAIQGGAGGAGGGTNGVNGGAGGGGGGGVMVLPWATFTLANASDVTCAGGASGLDGAGQQTAGAGGGGFLVLIYLKKGSTVFSAATNCPAGASALGIPASNGTVIEFNLN